MRSSLKAQTQHGVREIAMIHAVGTDQARALRIVLDVLKTENIATNEKKLQIKSKMILHRKEKADEN